MNLKAIILNDFGTAENLQLAEMPTPKPADDEVQIEVHYAGVNPVDWKIGTGMLKDTLKKKGMSWEFPLIPGWDASGVVTEVGRAVKEFKVGDEVFTYCRKPQVKWGTYAEYVNMSSSGVALKPKNLSFAGAAAVPLVGLTAWQALFDVGKLKKGQNVFIHAGAGGVGSLAIPLAKYAGATICTTASLPHHEYVKELGADHVIDYHTHSFVEESKELFPEGVDLCLDCVGGKTLNDSFEIVKPNGRLISICELVNEAKAKEHQIIPGFVFVKPNGSQLGQLGQLFDQGKLYPPHVEEMFLAQAKEALEKNQEGHTCGKIVLKVK